MSDAPVCRACGYAITVLDQPTGRVEVCPRCNRPLGECQAIRPGTILLGIVGVVLLFMCCVPIVVTDHTGPAREDEAVLKAQNIQKAAIAFEKSRGRFPESLDELVTPINGKLPLLEGGQSAITDPWQQRYQMELSDGPDGAKRIIVWTTTPDGKRIQWPRE